METGIDYPKITLGGREYTVRFSRGAAYRLDKLGFDLRTLGAELRRWFPATDETGATVPGHVRFSVLIDILHAAIDFRGSPEDLAELVPADRTAEIAVALVTAMAKAAPPAQTPAQETAASQTGPAVQ